MLISGRWECIWEALTIISAFESLVAIGISVAQNFDCYA